MAEQREGLATIAEAAEFLQLATPTVYALIHKGQIPGRRFGRTVRIPWGWLLAAADVTEAEMSLPMVLRNEHSSRSSQPRTAVPR